MKFVTYYDFYNVQRASNDLLRCTRSGQMETKLDQVWELNQVAGWGVCFCHHTVSHSLKSIWIGGWFCWLSSLCVTRTLINRKQNWFFSGFAFKLAPIFAVQIEICKSVYCWRKILWFCPLQITFIDNYGSNTDLC